MSDVVATSLAVADVGRPETAIRLVSICSVMQLRSTAADAAATIDFWLRMTSGDVELHGTWLARAEYNYANRLFAQAEYDESVAHYNKALEVDPGYRDRAYFCRERAAASFESGDYLAAIEWYERSYELESDSWVLPRIADCKLRAGFYREALGLFCTYLQIAQGDAEDVWVLYQWALEFAIERTGIERQVRDPATAEETLDADDDGVSIRTDL